MILPRDIGPIPEEQKWPLIGIYIRIDDVLAALYKQYCDAKAHFNQILETFGANDPMTDIAADLYESSCSAIETRLLEVKTSPSIRAQAQILKDDQLWQIKKREEEAKHQKLENNLQDLIIFILWINSTRNSQISSKLLISDFAQISRAYAMPKN